MSDIWLVSDTHFGHANILKFKDSTSGELVRPGFANVNEMDECMIDRWNSVVKQGDKVYHLGDVTMGDKEDFKKLWPKLNGKKTLIVGNHDDIKFLSCGGFFSQVHLWRKLPDFGLILSHIPLDKSGLFDYNNGEGYFRNVHGHIHQNPSPSTDHYNICVEVTDYTPINIETVRIK